MKLAKKIGLALLAAFIIIQFFRPARNHAAGISPNDISRVAAVPNDVQSVLARSCYDCHSNSTNYPWYMNIQPVAWYLADHVNEGKRELNFSEFGSYTPKKQLHKLEEIVKEVKKGEMPIKSYTLIHGDARLNEADKSMLVDWANSLAAKY
jgi:hypothetical protein